MRGRGDQHGNSNSLFIKHINFLFSELNNKEVRMPDYLHEYSVLVASTQTDQLSTKKFIENHINEIISRGEYARVCIVTGTHGSPTGNDGINDISCLEDSRKFYNSFQS